MYEGFRRFDIQTSDHEVRIRGVVGGSGPPVLLLHGNPLSHYHWRFVAPRLAKDFTVVATDLRGYGDSGKPRGLPDHSNYSFRRMAQDQVDVMRELGFERFMVAGHDRGARTAYRMALDHPAAVQKLCAIDILPTHHVWTYVTREWALNSYHWSFMAQPYDFPERLLAGKEEYYIRLDRLRDGPEGPRGRKQDRVSCAGDRRRPEPHREVLRLRERLGDLRREPGRLRRAALRSLSGRAGSGRNVRRAPQVLQYLRGTNS